MTTAGTGPGKGHLVTIPSFTSYQPPQVYVQDVSIPVVVTPLVPSQVITLVGPALGYRTAVQSLLLSAATAVALTYTGVFTTAQAGPPAIAAPVVTTLPGTILAPGVDYTLTVIADPSGNPGLASVTIVRVSSSVNVSDGQQVAVTYNYADAGYYAPQVFTDQQSVINAYGQPFLSVVPSTPNASQVANPLSCAAQVAFSNGATTLLCVACNPADGSLEQQLTAAYAKVATTAAATIVVPVFTDDLAPSSGTVAAEAQSVAQALNTAMVGAYNDGFPRIGFLGLPRNYSESDIPVPVLAASIASRRLVLAYPEVVLLYNTATSSTFQASGCYLAVALGAVLSSLPVNTGITNQVVGGTGGLPQSEVSSMTNAFMNVIAASGVSVCAVNYAGALVCRQGLTTDMSAINHQEISVVRQADALLVAVSQGLQGSGLIGQPITANTVSAVQEAVLGILESAVTQNVIISYQNVTVVQQAYPGGSPTVISVTFTYLPALPLNYITVQMSIDLAGGLVATQSQQNASSTGT
jgi:hypothetical protein